MHKFYKMHASGIKHEIIGVCNGPSILEVLVEWEGSRDELKHLIFVA